MSINFSSKISSTQNQKVKDIVKLRQAKHRKKSNHFIIEGGREIYRAQSSGYRIIEAYVFEKNISNDLEVFFSKNTDKIKLFEVSEAVFDKIAVRETTGGAVVIAEKKNHSIELINEHKVDFAIIIDGVEKPGNIGAILRSCDGVGVDAVFISDSSCDVYSPNSIRASLGGVFSQKIFTASDDEIFEFLSSKNKKIISLTPHTDLLYHQADLSAGGVVVLGSEAFGVSEYWDQKANVKVKIPMNGLADSLNVSVAGAVLLYDMKRQMIQSK